MTQLDDIRNEIGTMRENEVRQDERLTELRVRLEELRARGEVTPQDLDGVLAMLTEVTTIQSEVLAKQEEIVASLPEKSDETEVIVPDGSETGLG